MTEAVNALQGIVLVMLAVSQVGLWIEFHSHINRDRDKR